MNGFAPFGGNKATVCAACGRGQEAGERHCACVRQGGGGGGPAAEPLPIQSSKTRWPRRPYLVALSPRPRSLSFTRVTLATPAASLSRCPGPLAPADPSPATPLRPPPWKRSPLLSLCASPSLPPPGPSVFLHVYEQFVSPPLKVAYFLSFAGFSLGLVLLFIFRDTTGHILNL